MTPDDMEHTDWMAELVIANSDRKFIDGLILRGTRMTHGLDDSRGSSLIWGLRAVRCLCGQFFTSLTGHEDEKLAAHVRKSEDAEPQ